MTMMRMAWSYKVCLSKRCLRFVHEGPRTRGGTRPHSTTSDVKPLFLWLGKTNGATTTTTPNNTPSLLLPVRLPLNIEDLIVRSPESVVQRVTDHYASSENFVGAMGESDPGVWFAAASGTSMGDALEAAELIQTSIELVKEERHGVPFGVYTTGLVSSSASSSMVPLVDLGIDCLKVSLHGSTPLEYARATGIPKEEASKLFGTVCGFIVEAVEQGVAVEVCVQKDFAAGTRDLALSLGAQNVHVYP